MTNSVSDQILKTTNGSLAVCTAFTGISEFLENAFFLKKFRNPCNLAELNVFSGFLEP
jgi:hypothetical protein